MINKFDLYRNTGILYVIVWFTTKELIRNMDHTKAAENNLDWILVISPLLTAALFTLFAYGFIIFSRRLEDLWLQRAAFAFFYIHLIRSIAVELINFSSADREAMIVLTTLFSIAAYIFLGYRIFKIHRQVRSGSYLMALAMIIYAGLKLTGIAESYIGIGYIFVVTTMVIFFGRLHHAEGAQPDQR